MRQFYLVFRDRKVSPLGTQLSWSHCRSLLSVKDYDEINYYINLTINQNLSKRELEHISLRRYNFYVQKNQET